MTDKEIISSLRGLIGKYNLTDEEWQTIEKTIEILSNSDEDCISRTSAEMCLTADITDMTIEEYISMVGDRLKGLPSIQPSYTGCDYYDYEAKTCRRAEVPTDEDCISRARVDKLIQASHLNLGNLLDTEIMKERINALPSVQPKEIYNKGWKDGAEATAYHVELCEKENPTIPMSVIEGIKADIVTTVCEESKQCDGDYAFLKWCAGLKYSLRIIDKHIEDIGGK